MEKSEFSLIKQATFLHPLKPKLGLAGEIPPSTSGTHQNEVELIRHPFCISEQGDCDQDEVQIVLDIPGQGEVKVEPDFVQVINGVPINSVEESFGPSIYSFLEARGVECFPGSDKTVPVLSLCYDDVKFSHVVFDNLNAARKLEDPPFFMGKIATADLPPNMVFEAVAKELWNFPSVTCNSNLNKYRNERMTKGTAGGRGRINITGMHLFNTGKEGCDRHTLKDTQRTRLCSHYFQSEMKMGSENKLVEKYGLSRWMEIPGMLASLTPASQRDAGAVFTLTEKDHVDGFHREVNLYCKVNLLLKGRKRWTFIDPAGNSYFQGLCQSLVRKQGESVKNCSDPAQHRKFAIFFEESYTGLVRYVVEQRSGEVMLIPPSVYYQVEVLEPSLCISFNCLDAQWCKLPPEEFDSQCTHFDRHGQTALEAQKAAYYQLVKYANQISTLFLEHKDLHPPSECLGTFFRKRRLIAMRSELETDAPEPKRRKKTPVAQQQVHKDAGVENQEFPPTVHDRRLQTPLYDRAVGENEIRKVLVEMMTTFRCDACGKYFPNSLDARFHCSREDITCCHCGRTVNNPYNKGVHENKCLQNPEVKKAREEKAAAEKEEKERRLLLVIGEGPVAQNCEDDSTIKQHALRKRNRKPTKPGSVK